MTNHQEFGGFQPAHHVESTVPVLKYHDACCITSAEVRTCWYSDQPLAPSQPATQEPPARQAVLLTALPAAPPAALLAALSPQKRLQINNGQGPTLKITAIVQVINYVFSINQICFIGFGCFTFTSHQVFRPITNNCLYLLCPQLVLYWRLYWRPPAPGHWLVRHSQQVPCH